MVLPDCDDPYLHFSEGHGADVVRVSEGLASDDFLAATRALHPAAVDVLSTVR